MGMQQAVPETRSAKAIYRFYADGNIVLMDILHECSFGFGWHVLSTSPAWTRENDRFGRNKIACRILELQDFRMGLAIRIWV